MLHDDCIAKGVWRLALPSATLPPFNHTNSYLLVDSGEAALVDMGSTDERAIALLKNLLEEAEVGQLNAIWLTHSHHDHCAGVALLQQHWPDVSVWGHDIELARRSEIKHPRVWREAELWQVGTMMVEPIFTPGHSPGHLSFFLPQHNLAIVGDMLASQGSVWVGVPEGDVSLYLESLAKLESLGARLLAPGHGELIDQPLLRLQAVRDHRLAREQEVLQALLSSSELSGLRQQIYPELEGALVQVAESTIQAHLLRLIEHAKVVEGDAGFVLV